MASGVQTEKDLSDVLGTPLSHAVLVTRERKRFPDLDLFLRTGSGRAKKDVSPRHVGFATIAMVSGPPKSAVSNALTFGNMVAGKVEQVVRDGGAATKDASTSVESVITADLRVPARQNPLMAIAFPNAPVADRVADTEKLFPKGQLFIDALTDLLSRLAHSKEHDLILGLNPLFPDENKIEVWLSLRPTLKATIVHRHGNNFAIRRHFHLAQAELGVDAPDLARAGRSSFELLEWPALVAMAKLVSHDEQAQASLLHPNSKPLSAERGKDDPEISATPTNENAALAGAAPKRDQDRNSTPGALNSPEAKREREKSQPLSSREPGRPTQFMRMTRHGHAEPHPAFAPVT